MSLVIVRLLLYGIKLTCLSSLIRVIFFSIFEYIGYFIQTYDRVPCNQCSGWMMSSPKVLPLTSDEFRCPVYVKDVVSTILALSEKWISGMQFSKFISKVK